MRKAASNIILSAATVLCVMIAGEIAIRVSDAVTSRRGGDGIVGYRDFRGWKVDPVLNRVHIPGYTLTYRAPDGKEFSNEVTYNSKGLHDYEYQYEKPEGTGRILVFGDSFVEALQVKKESNFCKLIEQELATWPTQQAWQVINMGVSGYSPILAYLYLDREGLRYRPDIVIQCFFMNDVYEDMAYKGMAVFDNEGLPLRVHWKGFDKTEKLDGWKRVERKITNAVKVILKKSRFYVFVKGRAYRLLSRLGLREDEEARNQFFVLTDDREKEDVVLWDTTFRYVRAMRDRAEMHGAHFLFVVIPLEAQIREDPQDAAFRAYFKEKPDSRKISINVENYCAKYGIEYVDLLNEFSDNAVSGGTRLYFNNDGHFNEQGHRETASILMRKLKSLEWIR